MRIMGGKSFWLGLAVALLAAVLPIGAMAQEGSSGSQESSPAANEGTLWGNYSVHQTFDFGARYTNLSGNPDNYDTLVNLQSGARLLDYSLDMSSVNHKNSLFDHLTLTGFGFGGDPNAVARLGITKGKWYNFTANFRRDQYLFGYNYLANPFNPSSSNPTLAVTTALHNIDFARRMSDFDLTLLPLSPIRFRVGYSHIREQGPSLTTVGAANAPGVGEVGIDTALAQNYSTSTDLYRAGFDVKYFPKTVLSFTEIVQYTKGDTFTQDQNFLYQLSNQAPVDLGVVFNTVGGTPCKTPLAIQTVPPAVPPVANPGCAGILSYNRDQRPRLTMPTEQFSFQTSYIKNLSMSGLVSYSSGTINVNNMLDSWTGLSTRTLNAGDLATGSDKAKRVLVDGNWGALYQVTHKFAISDTFGYNSFRLPGQFDFVTVNPFYQAVAGGPSMLAPLATFDATDCPAPYTASTCPQHNSSSSADSSAGTAMRYLGQNLAMNTIQFEYSFTPRWGAHLGYRYTKRKIYAFNAVNYLAEIFDPGGSAGATDAARGDCSLPAGETLPANAADLPAGCTLNSDGSVTFSGLTPASDTAHNVDADINGHSALFGIWGRPTDKLRTNFDMELFSADASFTRITPRQLQRYSVQASYLPIHWAEVSGSVNIVESRDNVVEVQNKEHNRNFTGNVTLSPSDTYSFDLGYDYSDIYTQALVCYALGFGPPPAGQVCPIAGSPVAAGSLSTYADKSHFLYKLAAGEKARLALRLLRQLQPRNSALHRFERERLSRRCAGRQLPEPADALRAAPLQLPAALREHELLDEQGHQLQRRLELLRLLFARQSKSDRARAPRRPGFYGQHADVFAALFALVTFSRASGIDGARFRCGQQPVAANRRSGTAGVLIPRSVPLAFPLLDWSYLSRVTEALRCRFAAGRCRRG
jgi:hypothetical protein